MEDKLKIIVFAGTFIMVVVFVFIFLFMIIYERKRSSYKAELSRLELQHQKKLLEAIITTQENEKQEFAAELHDSLSQILTTQLMTLHGLETAIKNPEYSLDNLPNTIDQLKTLNKQSISETRSISRKLMPVVLNDFGLIEALTELITKVNESGSVKANLYKPSEDIRFPADIERALYRVSQELINNTIKYAHAKLIEIKVEVENDSINYQYSDDGIGFEVNEKIGKGIGLLSMQSRISAVNGKIQFTSSPDSGYQVNVIIPLKSSI